jgi:cbb3-type cytochrome oxidase subunit 3
MLISIIILLSFLAIVVFLFRTKKGYVQAFVLFLLAVIILIFGLSPKLEGFELGTDWANLGVQMKK